MTARKSKRSAKNKPIEARGDFERALARRGWRHRLGPLRGPGAEHRGRPRAFFLRAEYMTALDGELRARLQPEVRARMVARFDALLAVEARPAGTPPLLPRAERAAARLAALRAVADRNGLTLRHCRALIASVNRALGVLERDPSFRDPWPLPCPLPGNPSRLPTRRRR